MHGVHWNMRWKDEDFENVRAEAARMGITVTSLVRQATLDLVNARRAARGEVVRTRYAIGREHERVLA